MDPIEAATLDQIQAAAKRIAGAATRTPLVRLHAESPYAEIHLKLENLQPIGAFKIRGAMSAISAAAPESLKHGVVTASAGNMAQGVAWVARLEGIPCTVVVPETAPAAKIAAIERLGGRVVRVPFDAWWQAMVERRHPGVEGFFVHPVSDPEVVAGNGTIGLELLEDLPDVDVVLVPFGGGGLSGGIASAMRAAGSMARVYACEVATAAPLSASLAAGRPATVDYVPSFVDGIGAKGLLAEMWPLVSRILAGSIVVSPEEAAEAVRLLVTRVHVVAEGAGAVPAAAALAGRIPAPVAKKVVCIVSGGNIDPRKLARILEGETP